MDADTHSAEANPDRIDRESSIPSDLLARAFLDILARAVGAEAKPLLRGGDPEDPIERLLDDLSGSDVQANKISIRSDLAAVAILTARAIEAVPGLVRELRRGNPVVAITTHGADIVRLVAEVVEQCAFGSDLEALESGQHASRRVRRTALMVIRDGTEAGHKPEKGNDHIAAAIHTQSPIIGIAPDPRRHLPRDLLRAAEYRLTIGDIDENAIALVVEAVTGQRSDQPIDAELVRAVDVSDLQLAFRKNQTPDECIRRLGEIVRMKGIFDEDGPTLDELSGYGAAKEWGLNLASDLAAYRRGRLDWAAIEKGLLLDGPPGVGKSQYAKALARSAGVPIVATSVAEWNAANYLSGTLQAMQSAFIQARKLAPSILFIDELDGISDRSRLQGDYVEYWAQIVNQLLELLAGVDDRPGVVVVAATNHADKIDPAVRRAGRLDRTIAIARPDIDDLRDIFRYYLKDDLPTEDLMPLALAARGGTGADIEAWVRRARSRARRANRTLVTQDILLEINGKRTELSFDIRSIITIHEASHIVVGAALRCYEPEMVWITTTGGLTSGDVRVGSDLTLQGLEYVITTLLAGRAGEKILLGAQEVTVGAGLGEDSDLMRATQIALDIETRFGLGDNGLIHIPEGSREYLLHDKAMLEAIRHRLDRCHLHAETIVQLHCPAILTIALALRESGYLDRATILQMLRDHNLDNSHEL